MKKWKLSNKMINDVLTLLEGLKYRAENELLSAWEIFNLGLDFSLKIEALVLHLGKEAKVLEVTEIHEQLSIHQSNELALTGHDLMKETSVRPGLWMSQAIDEALRAVVEKRVNNEKEEILQWLNEKNCIPYTNE